MNFFHSLKIFILTPGRQFTVTNGALMECARQFLVGQREGRRSGTTSKSSVHPAVASAPSTAPQPSAHATATAVRSDGAQMICLHLLHLAAVQGLYDARCFSQVRLAGVASCCCTLAARSVVATKVRAARAWTKRCGQNYFFDYHRASDPTRALLQHLHCCCSMPAPCTLPGGNMGTRRAPTATSAYRSKLRSAVAPSAHPPAKFAAGRATVSA